MALLCDGYHVIDCLNFVYKMQLYFYYCCYETM